MWKVEFAHTLPRRKITLYVATDAFIYEQPLNANITLDNSHIQECLKSLASKFARENKQKADGDDEIIYIRSLYFFKEDDSNYISLAMHAKSETVDIADNLTHVVYRVSENNKLGSHEFSCEEIRDASVSGTFRKLFGNDESEAWGRYLLKLNKRPPICEAPVPPIDIKICDDDDDADELLTDYIKENLIIALYNAARDYYLAIWQLALEKPDSLTENINLFNIQFAGVASISPDLSFTDIKTASLALQDFPLTDKESDASLEAVINNLVARCAETQNNNSAYEHIIKRLNEFNQRVYLDPYIKKLISGNFYQPLTVAADDRLIQSISIVPGARALSSHAISAVILARNKLVGSAPKKLFEFIDKRMPQGKPVSEPEIDMGAILAEVQQLQTDADRDLAQFSDEEKQTKQQDVAEAAEPASPHNTGSINFPVAAPSENGVKNFFAKLKPSYLRKHHPVLFKALIGLAIGLVVAAIAAAIITAVVFTGGGAAVAAGGAAVVFAATVSSTTTLATLGGVAGVAGIITGIGIAAAGGGMAAGATIGAVQESKKRKRISAVNSDDLTAISSEENLRVQQNDSPPTRSASPSPTAPRKAKQARFAERATSPNSSQELTGSQGIHLAPPKENCRLFQAIPGLRDMYNRDIPVPSNKEFLRDVATLYLEISNHKLSKDPEPREKLINAMIENLFRLSIPQPTFDYALRSVLKSEAYQGFNIEVFHNTHYFPAIEKAVLDIREAAKREYQHTSSQYKNITHMFHPPAASAPKTANITEDFKVAALKLYQEIAHPDNPTLLGDDTLHKLNQRKLTLPTLTYAVKTLLQDDQYKDVNVELFQDTLLYNHIREAHEKLSTEAPALRQRAH